MKTTNAKGSSAAAMKEPLLEEFFTDMMKDIYWAEKHLVKALQKMEKAATSPKLQKAFAEHRTVTEKHIERLETAFEKLDQKPVAKKCDAMEGLIKESESIIEETEAGTLTRDVGLIVAAQKVEHYEIASYGSMVQLAKTLGMNDVAKILFETLEEEKAADQLLTDIAEGNINAGASNE